MPKILIDNCTAARLACLLFSLCACLAVAQEARVAVAQVVAMPEQQTLSLAGELKAIRSTVLSAEVAGSVDSVAVEAGDRVAVDAALAVIREQPAQLQLQVLQAGVREASAGVERARINERRLKRLLPRNAVSQDEYDTARVELQRAEAVLAARQAEVEQQSERLSRHHIRAPFAGTVVARHIEQGQWLDVGDPCYAVDDTSTLRAALAVPQQYYNAIHQGSQVQVRFDAMPERSFELLLTRKLPVVRRAGRSFEVWLELDNRQHGLVPGLSLQAEIPMQKGGKDLMLVPRDAVLKAQDGASWLWLVEQQGEQTVVRQASVQVLGAKGAGLIVQAAELQAGMQVVTRGNESLHEGQTVHLIDAG